MWCDEFVKRVGDDPACFLERTAGQYSITPDGTHIVHCYTSPDGKWAIAYSQNKKEPPLLAFIGPTDDHSWRNEALQEITNRVFGEGYSIQCSN